MKSQSIAGISRITTVLVLTSYCCRGTILYNHIQINKHLIKRTQACSDKESDFEFPESLETAINMEQIKKIIEVSGHIETPEEKSGS